MNFDLSEELKRAAEGGVSEVFIYWDNQDPLNTGPAWRSNCNCYSGPLYLNEWAKDDRAVADSEVEGYNLYDFFDGDGHYSGPDVYGIYPSFES